MLTFSSGQTAGALECAMVFSINDRFIEDVETFSVSLSASTSNGISIRFTPGANVATVSIVQDPDDSKYSISNSNLSKVSYLICIVNRASPCLLYQKHSINFAYNVVSTQITMTKDFVHYRRYFLTQRLN